MPNKYCPGCKTKTHNSKICEEGNRIYSFFPWKCKINGSHYHNFCEKCGAKWVVRLKTFVNQWTANVIDQYKGLSIKEIKQRNFEKSFPYAVLLNNFTGDFNISSAIRNANAFGVREIYYFGKRKYDKRGAAGAYLYSDITFLDSFKKVIDLKSKYKFIGVDNIEGAKPINDYAYPCVPLLVFGEEQCGISKDILEICDDLIYIKQYGSIRSINCAAASAVILNDFCSKYEKKANVL